MGGNNKRSITTNIKAARKSGLPKNLSKHCIARLLVKVPQCVPTQHSSIPNFTLFAYEVFPNQVASKYRKGRRNVKNLARGQTSVLWVSTTPTKISKGPAHIRRFQEFFNHINILISSSTLQFLQFWYQNGVNYLFLIVKSIEVTSGFISKVLKKFARWRHHWNIWYLIAKTKISPLVVCHQGYNGCQKNQ